MNEDLQVQIANEKLALGIEKPSEQVTESVKVSDELKNEDPFLEEALKMGFDPEHKGPNKKSPEQFVKDGSFFRKIESQNKKIDELIAFNKQQMEHNKKLEKASYQQALEDLQKAKRDAITDADADRVFETEKQLEIVKEQIKQSEVDVLNKPKPVEITDVGRKFQERNLSWLNGTDEDDRRMRVLAQKVIEYLNEVDPSVNESSAIEMIEAEVKSKFPHKFENENQKKPLLVGKSTVNQGVQKDSFSIEGLSQRQKDFIKQARMIDETFKTDDYIRQLRLTGEIQDE